MSADRNLAGSLPLPSPMGNGYAAVLGLTRSRRARLALAAVVFSAVTLVMYRIAHYRISTGFAAYDDEGYMLIALKSFIGHGSLYDDVFTQYGPFYYEAWGGLFSLFGIPVTHDAGRTVTTVVWVLTSLTLGLSTIAITRSILLGLAVEILAFSGLYTLTAEPMHPGGMICLLLATIIAISCAVGTGVSRRAMAALGGVVAALILVKINVGVFALAALALVCVVSYRTLANRRWLRLAVEAGFVLVPVVLMTEKLGEAWARHYAVHVAVAALAVVIALRSRSVNRRPPEELRWLLGGLVAVVLVVCLAIIALGTSPGGLVEGVLTQPLHQADALTIPLGLANQIYLFDLLALIGALVYWWAMRGRDPKPPPAAAAIVSLLSILIGAEMALSVVGRTLLFDNITFTGHQLGLLAFAWIALIPPPGNRGGGTEFARVLLPPLAVLQALHAYPVAGSQVLWSSFLLVPVGAICVANGVRGLAFSVAGNGERRGLAAVGVIAATVFMLALANTHLRQPLQEARAAYHAATPLDLPGASTVRVARPEAALYHGISSAIDRSCQAFLMLPGMNSFYLWTEQAPPTGYNATTWPTLFDDALQRRVVTDIRSIGGLCLLQNISIAGGWNAGTVPAGPLVHYLRSDVFRPIAGFGPYKLLRRGAGRKAMAPGGGSQNLIHHPGAVGGDVDYVAREGDTVFLSGWAANGALTEPADSAAAVIDGKPVAWAFVYGYRPDVVSVYKKPMLAKSGFVLAVQRSKLDCRASAAGLKVIGIVHNLATRLPLAGGSEQQLEDAC